MIYLVEFQFEIANIESNVLDQGLTPRDPHLTPLDQVTLTLHSSQSRKRACLWDVLDVKVRSWSSARSQL
jgi:hypothetical protein